MAADSGARTEILSLDGASMKRIGWRRRPKRQLQAIIPAAVMIVKRRASLLLLPNHGRDLPHDGGGGCCHCYDYDRR